MVANLDWVSEIDVDLPAAQDPVIHVHGLWPGGGLGPREAPQPIPHPIDRCGPKHGNNV